MIFKEYHVSTIISTFTFAYLLSWFFFTGASVFHISLMFFLHLWLLILGLSTFVFLKASPGTVDKLHISHDKDINVIG